ncbi:MAG: hypothetical protein AAF289_20225 [Cyanobacteria bacterium P01_A01_bin.135]
MIYLRIVILGGGSAIALHTDGIAFSRGYLSYQNIVRVITEQAVTSGLAPTATRRRLLYFLQQDLLFVEWAIAPIQKAEEWGAENLQLFIIS